MHATGNHIGEQQEQPADAGAEAAADLALLHRVKRGEKAAFHGLVDRYAGLLYRVARSLVGNGADAEDVVQETFAGAFRSAGRFREQSAVKTWLLRILVNQAAKVRRSRSRHFTIPLFRRRSREEDAGDVEAELAVSSATGQVEHRVDVMAMLNTLSAEHREVLVLRELEGLSYEEMAEALGVPRGTVESRLHRARQELRERFKGYL
jgi:RNA polymerase sigma-70 factor (ECF subfamily)